jgi:NTE family protein
LFEKDDFKSLKKELYITATNIIDGTERAFNEGELVKPVLAYAAFPGLFTPVNIGDIPI